jgi:arylsulfatase A-like enzyme
VQAFFRPYVYLDAAKLTEKGLNRNTVEGSIADALRRLNGVALAVPVSDSPLPEESPFFEMIRRNHHPARSGDVYVVQEPYWFLFAGGPVVAMHGSPYRYDTHVPLIFAGSIIPAQRVHHRVNPVDVAPTIAALLKIGSPALARGTVLQEVVAESH